MVFILSIIILYTNFLQACEDTVIARQRAPRLTSQGLTNILWGYATLRYYPEKILPILLGEMHSRVAGIGQQARPPCFLNATETCSSSSGVRSAPAASHCPSCQTPPTQCVVERGLLQTQ